MPNAQSAPEAARSDSTEQGEPKRLAEASQEQATAADNAQTTSEAPEARTTAASTPQAAETQAVGGISGSAAQLFLVGQGPEATAGDAGIGSSSAMAANGMQTEDRAAAVPEAAPLPGSLAEEPQQSAPDPQLLLKQHFPAWRRPRVGSAEYHLLPLEAKVAILERLTGHLLDVHAVRQVTATPWQCQDLSSTTAPGRSGSVLRPCWASSSPSFGCRFAPLHALASPISVQNFAFVFAGDRPARG